MFTFFAVGSSPRAVGIVDVDGSVHTKREVTVPANAGCELVVASRIPLTAASHTIKLQAQRTNATGGTVEINGWSSPYSSNLAGTQFTYRLVAQ